MPHYFMKILKLKNNKETVVDDNIYETVKDFIWSVDKNGYVSRRVGSGRIFLHRIVCGTEGKMHTDHINGDKLDNLRSNLRVLTTKENIWNSGIRVDNKTGLKGVSYRLDRKTYTAEICKDGKKYRLGCYKDKYKAGQAYNTMAIKLFGDKARLNEI